MIRLREYHIGQNRLEITRDIALAAPDVLLLSVYIWNAEIISAILPDLRAMLPACRLIVGGPEAAYNAGAWLAATQSWIWWSAVKASPLSRSWPRLASPPSPTRTA
jgi:anaerobic magnesium-protoporphyrin IX monomethyl ester cyclase